MSICSSPSIIQVYYSCLNQMTQFKLQKQSSFIFDDIMYFFSPSEHIDYYLGCNSGLSLQKALCMLQQNQFTFEPLAFIFSSLFQLTQQKQQKLRFYINKQNLEQLINNDGIKLLFCGIARVLQRLQEKDGGTMSNQMALKVLLNIIYVCVNYLQLDKNQKLSNQLNQLYVDVQIDNTFMKMVTMSLEVHYIPIKKLTLLYAKILANLFYHISPQRKSVLINPIGIYSEKIAVKLPQSNMLKYGEFQKYKASHPPPNGPLPNEKVTSIERYYRKHNTGECPLAQSVVVGLLRSLLTICNCQAHKKFQTVKGAGVDSFRQWQLSYRFLLQNPQLHVRVPSNILQRMRAYESFDQSSGQSQKGVVQPLQQQIWSQFYAHKIYTTAAITNFFMFMLVSLKQNMYIQFSYFLQLISDANGILVFLKFLTDKFTMLDTVKQKIVFSMFADNPDASFGFKQKVMLTIYGVLLMLYTSCNNYPQKIRNYLFQYNSYLIIKKIPTLFLTRTQPKQEEEELQGSQIAMPSREDIDCLSEQTGAVILRKLTELCYDLLRVQIPFFSKKMKENSTNMRMIVDIYCKFPKITEARQLTSLEKLMLKSKIGSKTDKYITSVEEMKTLHNEYNNIYYWSNDFINEPAKSSSQRIFNGLEDIVDPHQWLEDNIWKYYD